MATTANSDADKGLANLASIANMCDSGRLNTYDRGNDPFGSESNGTAKFLGTCVGAGSSTASGSGSGRFDFHTIKAANNNNQRTIRNELPKNELLKMLCYLEGELQARDVVIAALRNERVKQFLTQLRTKPLQTNDPQAALFRDKISLSGNLVSREASSAAVQAEMEVRTIIEQQMESLYQMVTKQRSTHVRMVNILTGSLENNHRLRQMLEEEKQKHEHDTAQGDDITYGLEMERTKLKQELETEHNQRKKLEKDIKKLQETAEAERTREKQLVLYLIAERKRIMMKYIEEGKRSEDLAQILSEEKQRSDTIAEDLEEESKKSLRIEAEIEKQAATFESERKAMKLTLAMDEKRIKELEAEVAQLRTEIEALKKQNSVTIRMQVPHNVPAPNLPAKVRSMAGDDIGAATMVNVAKIVQPTATVSSVPVSGPTTGIARSISPGQSLRQQATITSETSASASATAGFSAPPAKITPSTLIQSPPIGGVDEGLVSSPTPAAPPNGSSPASDSPAIGGAGEETVFALALGTISSSQVVHSQPQTLAQTHPLLSVVSSTATILRAGPSAANTAAAASVAASTPAASTAASTAQPAPGASIGAPAVATTGSATTAAPATALSAATTAPTPTATPARGVPPPIPPNKPVVPPKREPSISRLGSVTNTSK